LQTADTPKFLGLDGPGGVWQKQFGGVDNAGEGVIVGVLDTGITPESGSFAALPEPRPDADVIAGKWLGRCDTSGENPVECNNKLIGARYYNTDEDIVIADRDFLSARDYNGHGTHTSSTAAGNNGVPATVNGESVGKISGMAPAARVAMYKVCWEFENPDDPTDGGCPTSDSLAAIDDAVAEGVDVINYSIGGDPGAIVDPIEIAFLNAAAAGVFVAASAGNSGPDVSTADVCAGFQDAVVDVLVTKARRAAAEVGATAMCLGGGVAANSRLRALAAERCAAEGIALHLPSPKLCTDNGAMIAMAGALRLARGERAGMEMSADPGWRL